MPIHVDILSFDGGLVDELVEPRATALNHGRGCRRIENLISTPWGAAITRPPSRYMASTKGHGVAAFFDVVYSETIAFLCEFGNAYVRFFTNSGQVTSGGAAYEIASPYDADDVFELQVYNDAGTLYLAHPDHAPYRLVYAGEASWTLEAVPFEWGPFLDANTGDVTITPSGTTGSITLTASGNTFASTHVGAKWLIGHVLGQSTLAQTFTGNATTTTIAVSKDAAWRIVTTGSWDARLTIQKSYDGGSTWLTAAVFESVKDVNYDESYTETLDDCLLRMVVTDWTASTSLRATITVEARVAYGYVTISGFTSATVVSATVVETLAATTATTVWAEGAWSAKNKYPRGVGVVDNRLTWVGTTRDPTTAWMSHTNSYTDMRTGDNPADALVFCFTTAKGDPFLWLLGEQYSFYVGTPSAIYEMAAADPQSSISTSNKPGITRRIELGSSSIQPVRAQGTIVWMDPENLSPMHKQYDWEQDLLLSPDLNADCPTVTEPGIKQIVFQRGRVPIVWFLRTDGHLLGMTFKQRFRENVIGWHIHETDGNIEAIRKLPSSDGDRLWWIAARTVGGATVRHIERLDRLDLQITRAESHQLDSYVSYSGGSGAFISGITVAGGTNRVTVTTSAAHGLENGNAVRFAAVGGMTWLNEHILVVADKTSTQITLKTLGGSYVDGSLIGTYTSGGTVKKVAKTFTGLSHLAGREVYAVADGKVAGPFTIDAAGGFDLGYYANAVTAGLAFTWSLSPLRLVLPTPAGSTRGRQGRISGLWLSVYRSWECQVGKDASHLTTVRFGETVDSPNEAPELVTCDKLVSFDGGYSDDPQVLLTGSQPLPFCLRAMMVDQGVFGSRSA